MTASKIEWTEQVWNPLVGCTLKSPGCTNCYAMRMAHRLEAMACAELTSGTGRDGLAHYLGTTRKVNGHPVWTGKIGFSEHALLAPLRRRKPTRWFVNSMSDLFHEAVTDTQIDRIFAVMALCPQHTFQVLTKRSARMREWMQRLERAVLAWFLRNESDLLNDEFPNIATSIAHPAGPRAWPLPNVWLGVSVEDQTRADQRIPDLLATPAAVRWISAEPLLGPVDLTQWLHDSSCGLIDQDWPTEVYERDCTCTEPPEVSLGWVVAGGESGPAARPMHPDWARALRDQCAAANVPFFFKQWGEFAPGDNTLIPTPRNRHAWVRRDGSKSVRPKVEADIDAIEREERKAGRPLYSLMLNVGKKRAGRLLDGVTHDGFPA